MPPRHRAESWLAWLTLAFVAVFGPIETYYSIPQGLTSPYFLVDAIGIVMLAAGVVVSLRARPRGAPALLAVGSAWMGANFWRATLARVEELRRGGTLDFGSREVPGAIALTVFAMVCMTVGSWLSVRRARSVADG